MSTQYSKVTIAGHPIHPMLIAFPVTFYTTTLIAFTVYSVNGEMSAWQIGLRANVAGVVTAFVAAIPGFIDWARGIPSGTQAKTTGRTHMILNLVSLALFVVNLIAYRDHFHSLYALDVILMPNPVLAIVLSAIGVLCTVAAGALGWTLVQTHHVGVDLTTEQQRLDGRVAVNKRSV